MDRFLAALSNELPAALGGTKSVQRAASYFGRFAEQIAPPPAATSTACLTRSEEARLCGGTLARSLELLAREDALIRDATFSLLRGLLLAIAYILRHADGHAAGALGGRAARDIVGSRLALLSSSPLGVNQIACAHVFSALKDVIGREESILMCSNMIQKMILSSKVAVVKQGLVLFCESADESLKSICAGPISRLQRHGDSGVRAWAWRALTVLAAGDDAYEDERAAALFLGEQHLDVIEAALTLAVRNRRQDGPGPQGSAVQLLAGLVDQLVAAGPSALSMHAVLVGRLTSSKAVGSRAAHEHIWGEGRGGPRAEALLTVLLEGTVEISSSAEGGSASGEERAVLALAGLWRDVFANGLCGNGEAAVAALLQSRHVAFNLAGLFALGGSRACGMDEDAMAGGRQQGEQIARHRDDLSRLLTVHREDPYVTRQVLRVLFKIGTAANCLAICRLACDRASAPCGGATCSIFEEHDLCVFVVQASIALLARLLQDGAQVADGRREEVLAFVRERLVGVIGEDWTFGEIRAALAPLDRAAREACLNFGAADPCRVAIAMMSAEGARRTVRGRLLLLEEEGEEGEGLSEREQIEEAYHRHAFDDDTGLCAAEAVGRFDVLAELPRSDRALPSAAKEVAIDALGDIFESL